MSDDRVELTTGEIMLIRQAAERLRREFDGTFNAETIERYMLSSQEMLQSKAKFTDVAAIAHRAPHPRPAPCDQRSSRSRPSTMPATIAIVRPDAM